MIRRVAARLVVYLAALAVLSGGVALAYSSGNYSSGTYGSCEYGVSCSISLTSNGNISLDITPASGGSCTINSDSASVMTDDTNGYTLSLNDSSTSTALTSGSDTIAASSGSFASPTVLSANNWGYRIDGAGGFGSGPTTAQSNVSPPSLTFAGIQPSNGTPDTLAMTSGAADPAVATTVWFGACADTSVHSGTYTSQALYTAVAN